MKLSRRTFLGTAALGGAAGVTRHLTGLSKDSSATQTGNPPEFSSAGVPVTRVTATTAQHTIDPTVASVQELTLSPPPSSDVYRANTLTLTVSLARRPWTTRLLLRQDRTGGRFVTWLNVRWVDDMVPTLNPAPDATTSVELWSADGSTIWGWTPRGVFPGVDPTNIPALSGIWEAWSLPQDVGETVSEFTARSGPQLLPTSTNPRLVDYVGQPHVLGPGERSRRGVSFADGGSATAPTSIRERGGWTLVASFFNPGSTSDICLFSLFHSDLSQSVALETTADTPYVRLNGTTISQYDDLYRAVAGGIIVVTLIQPAGVEPGILRWNGHQINVTTPWYQPLPLDTLIINDLPPGPLRHVGATTFGSIFLAPQPLPHVAPSDPVPLIERWAAGALGQSL